MQEKIKLTVELPRVFASLSDVSEKALPGGTSRKSEPEEIVKAVKKVIIV